MKNGEDSNLRLILFNNLYKYFFNIRNVNWAIPRNENFFQLEKYPLNVYFFYRLHYIFSVYKNSIYKIYNWPGRETKI